MLPPLSWMLTFIGVFYRFWGDLIIIKLVLEKFIESLFTSHQAFTLNSSWFIIVSSCLELSEEIKIFVSSANRWKESFCEQ